MNYLSHFLLSVDASDDVHLGNFLGDVIRKNAADTLPESIQEGIRFHRFVDHFTDNHPLIIEGKRNLYPYFGKYASVILDVYLDFALIEDWTNYSNMTIQKFINQCYFFLDNNMDSVPVVAQKRVQSMNAAQWMNGYLIDDGRHDLFMRLAKRARYAKNFESAVDIYGLHQVELVALHQTFFPLLKTASLDWLKTE